MSSSVFIESSVPKSATEAEAAKADSNLVVVYGKNGINFDRKGLENLIEEKTLSSISVIRLTSPTPSMEAEEEEAEKLEDIGSDEESDVDGERDTPTEDEERIKSNESGEDDDSAGEDNANHTDEYDENAVTDDKSAEAGKNKKKSKKKRTSTKLQRMKRQQRRERPEIVGLTVEEFYTAEDANAVLKEVLRKAGVSTIKHSAEYEFQLYVIKNDHCYTPFTSPEEMKTKAAAAKPDAERQTNFSNRKALLPVPIVTKQLLVKKKIQQQQQPSEELRKPLIIKGRSDVKGKSIVGDKTQKRNESDEFKDEEIHNSTAEEEIADDEEEDDDESEFYESEVSLETDNDRDSDLDFNINNRKGQKRKMKRSKRGLIVKTLNRRHKHSQDDSDEATVISMPRSKVNRSISSDTGRPVAQKSAMPIISQASTPGRTAIEAVSMPKPISEAIAALPPIPKKQTIAAINNPGPSRQQQVLAATVRRGPIVQVGGTETKSSKIHSSPQTVKEIVISKVTASPKGGFTDIGTLLAQSDNVVSATPTTPKSSTRPQIKISPSSKGFMPLVIESATKNQLPAQISLQTHQSSSELAAEHDKQLDLIDSIVKNEMQKSGIVEQAASINENIPELVEMLESTAKALELNKMPSVTNYTATTATTANEDDIDISNTQLLETPEDDIPDDFLQHVVQLMKEDFGDDSSEEVAGVLSTAETPPPLAPIFQQSLNSSGANVVQQQQTPPTAGQSTKSIIQMAISQSGTDSPDTMPSIRDVSSTSSSRLAGIHTPKTAPLVRKEPIQIVRGNGRVITLPPIEAPTTRAKRRAQTQPSQHSFTAATLNESSLDSSLQSNSSFTAAIISDAGAVAEKKPAEAPVKRRVSKESTFSAGAGKSAKKASAKKANTNKSNANKGDNAEEPSVSHGDDDDPNKLWCICRQPHNNRFMICCDICEDWFHGTCVNITKAMGLQMEQKSIDWTCPKCVKAQEEKKQRKITDMLLVKKTPEEHLEEQIAETATMSTTNTASESIDMNVELVAQTTSIPKPEATVKKQLIEIKKIQSGQFISLKSLELAKKSTSPVVTSGPKRLFPPSQTPQTIKVGDSPATPATPTQVKRVIVQNVHKSKAPTAGAHQPDGGTSLSARAPLTQCIVCKKVARPNSIYCSDDCIRRHAQNALQAFTSKSPEPSSSSLTKGVQEDKKKKAKGLFEDLLLMADRKPKVERVHVFERKSGRVLTGHNAPTTANLKKWLQDNPTFEVVQPGSIQALEIEKKQKQRTMHFASPTSNKSFSLSQLASPQNVASPQPPHTKSLPTTPAPKAEMVLMFSDSAASLPKPPKPVKQLVVSAKLSPKINRPSTPKQLNKYPSQVSIRPPDKVNKTETKDDTKTKEKALKRQSSDSGGKKYAENTPSTDSEPIRLNVRRTLKEQLLLRINELPANEAKLTAEEVKDFVTQTEAEMYSYFNRDAGLKYKAKYRSLMFNIKDRKNNTLLAKICAKQIGAKQLAHVPAEELASQELAQWRENEAKHQLEMIKKSELDMLSCAKNYVLKTHKGEEVIEDKLTDRVNLDLTIPVEDVVSVLNNDTAVGSSDGDLDRSATSTGTYTKKDYTHSSELHSSLTSSYHHVENSASEKTTEDHGKVSHREKERDKELERGHDREKRHKSKDRHRDKSRARRRSRSRSRSRSHSREKRHKSSHKDERRERDEKRDRSADREGGRERAREREHKDDADHKSLEKKIPTTSSNSSATSSTAYTKSSHGKEIKKKPATPKPLGAFSLIDQILESSKTIEEAANLVTEKELPRQITPPPTSTSSATLLSQEHKTQQEEPSTEDTVDYDEEPTSTVSIATPPQDPYLRYSGAESPASSSGSLPSPINAIWGGNINMIDVASFQIILQSVVGNAVNLGKLLPLELDVVGRIGPDTVWDYISKIKKSPNKEIVIIRLLPSNETETSAYTILYQYLDKRKRLGVIKTASSQIKDFYIYPLGAGKRMPPILQSTERVDFYEDASRPDMLVGIVIRVIGKRNLAASIPVLPTMVPSAGSAVKFPRGPIADAGSFTPPGSPKRRKTIHSTKSKDDEIDIDAIIKAPIAAKTHKSSGVIPAAPVASAVDEADEPYSPGGSSDDDMPMLPVKTPSALLNTNQAPNYELKRKMDELNRQIAAQEMEIAGLLNVEPSRYASSSTKTSTVLANISIPSNLSQILASIKSKPESHSTSLQTGMPPPLHIGSLMTSSADDEEYNPEEAITNISYESPGKFAEKPSSGSRLAQLSEAELLSMVPDDMMEETLPPVAEKKSRFEEPPPPGV